MIDEQPMATATPRRPSLARRKLVYVAGPYTHPTPTFNTHRAVKIGDKLMSYGIIPFIPHLAQLWDTISPKPYQAWIDLDEEYVQRCDALYRFPGASHGADLEVALATKVGIPVFLGKEDLDLGPLLDHFHKNTLGRYTDGRLIPRRL